MKVGNVHSAVWVCMCVCVGGGGVGVGVHECVGVVQFVFSKDHLSIHTPTSRLSKPLQWQPGRGALPHPLQIG